MSTKLIGGIIVVLLIAGGWVLMSRGDNVNTQEETIEESAEHLEQEETSKKMAFADFIKQGGSYECSVNMHMNGTDAEGKTYVSGDKIKAEYTVTMQGMNITSNMIVKDGYTYSWSSAAPNMGVKIKNMAATTGTAPVQGSGSYGFDANAIGDYDCHSWSENPLVFTLPSGVTFQEVKTQ